MMSSRDPNMKLHNASMHPQEDGNILVTQVDRTTDQDHRFEKISDNRINLKPMSDKEVETSQDKLNITSAISTTKEIEHPQAWAIREGMLHHIQADLKVAIDQSKKKDKEQAILHSEKIRMEEVNQVEKM